MGWREKKRARGVSLLLLLRQLPRRGQCVRRGLEQNLAVSVRKRGTRPLEGTADTFKKEHERECNRPSLLWSFCFGSAELLYIKRRSCRTLLFCFFKYQPEPQTLKTSTYTCSPYTCKLFAFSNRKQTDRHTCPLSFLLSTLFLFCALFNHTHTHRVSNKHPHTHTHALTHIHTHTHNNNQHLIYLNIITFMIGFDQITFSTLLASSGYAQPAVTQ